jgi:glycosyltransferase involved in cell wall biosynthesis
MRIAILGTRGIPNHYGGFEQCAEYLAQGLVKRGYEVIVYNSHNHPYKESEWNGVQLIHMYDPEFKLGTMGQFIYDFNCIRDVRKRNCDIILQLGYTSNSVWGSLLPKNAVVTTNMDGLEWKRTKFSGKVRKFLLFAESCGVKFSDHLISDSVGIQKYIKEKYNKDSTYIPYGADEFLNPDPLVLDDYFLTPYNYDLLIARLEPENSIEIILDGVVKADQYKPFLVIGNHHTKYGEYLKEKYKGENIEFVGGIYNINKLNNLRYYSNLYFHGHTVGGTNPSLLEAMASGSLLSANDNVFNRHILGDDALYFTTAEEVCQQLKTVHKGNPEYARFVENNTEKINRVYTWERITNQYEAHFKSILGIVTRPSVKVAQKADNIFDYALRMFL